MLMVFWTCERCENMKYWREEAMDSQRLYGAEALTNPEDTEHLEFREGEYDKRVMEFVKWRGKPCTCNSMEEENESR